MQKRITERRGTVAKSAFSTDRRPTNIVTDVGPITVTTPTRTACDLAMNCTPETQSPVTEIVCMLMQEFRFRPDDCLQVMQEATHIRNAPRARQFFRTIDGKQ